MTEEEKKEEKAEALLADLREHSKSAREIVAYSIQRIDLLIISVSGAGIYACLEILKFLYEHNKQCGALSFKITGLFFTTSIIVNFISQWTAYYASLHNGNATKKVISDIVNKSDSTVEINKLDCYVKIYGLLTKITNITSTLLMLIGLVLIGIFICITF